MENNTIKIDKTNAGVTLIIPERHEAKTCVVMPGLDADQKWNAIVGAYSRVTLCERDIRESEIIVEEGAQLDLLCLQTAAHPTPHVMHKNIILRNNAVVRVFTGLFDSAQIEITGRLEGSASVFENHVMYFGSAKQRMGMKLAAVHSGKGTMSRTLVRGVAVENAHADMDGTIQILESGSGTDAHLAHEGLLLSRKARIDSLPGLEIGTNDVKATHSSAIHFVRPEQMFYLQVRGVDALTAKQMIIRGFLEEMLATVREEDILKTIDEHVTAKEQLV
jgi:Fe-S cluster assembly scaffold protein SufB